MQADLLVGFAPWNPPQESRDLLLAVNDTVTFEPWESQWELLGRGATVCPKLAQHLTTLFAYLSRVLGSQAEGHQVQGELSLNGGEIHAHAAGSIQIACDLSRMELTIYGFKRDKPLRVQWTQAYAGRLYNIARARGVNLPEIEGCLPRGFSTRDLKALEEYQRWIRNSIRIFDGFAHHFEGRSGFGLTPQGQLQVQIFRYEQEQVQSENPLWSLALHLCDAKLGLPLWSTSSPFIDDSPRLRLRGEQLLKQAGIRAQTQLFSAFIERLEQHDIELLRRAAN